MNVNESIDIFGNTLLHEAVMKNDVDKIRYLLKQGADVNKKNKFGETPLSLAVEYDSDLMLYVDDELRGGMQK